MTSNHPEPNSASDLLNRATALDAASEGIALTDADGCYTYINPAHLSLFGYQHAAEVLGKSWHIFYTQEEIEFIEKSIFPALLKKKNWKGRVRGHRKDRSHFIQELSLSLLPDGGIACICSNATERIQSIEQRERLFALSKSLLLICDFEGNIKQFNPSWTDLLGYSREEFESRSILSHVLPEDQPATEAAMEDLRCGFPVVNFTNRFLACDGRILTLDWSSTSSVEQGLVFASAHNITMRRAVEQSLKESEDNFRRMFETLDDMIFVGGPSGNILFSNPAATRKLGFSAEELQSMRILDLHPAELRKQAGEILAAMFRRERDSCPLPLQKKNGTLLRVETRIWPGKWNGVDCVFGLCKDITEEQEAHQRFELLIRNNPAAMALSSLPERRLVDVNTAFLGALGYSKEEVIGKTVLELGLFPDADAYARSAAILGSEGRLHNMELQVRRKDGTLLEGLFSAEVVLIKGQAHLLSVMVDVSALNHATRMLRESEQRIQKIADNVPGVVYQYRLRPDGTSCFPFASNAIRNIYRVSPEEVREDASSVLAMLHPEDHDGVVASILKSAQDQTPWQYEYRVKFPDGTVRTLYGNSVPQREADGSVLWHGFITDITARKHAESVVLKNLARAEELTRLRSRFVSMASHELRTPLANIQLACDLLKNFGTSMPAEQSQSVFSSLMTGVASMVRTIDDLLLAGKIEEGQLPCTPTSFPLLDFLKRCAEEVRSDTELPSRIEIAFCDAGFRVTADERLLHHVLTNLLENALKYSPGDTKIRLGVEVGTDSFTISVLDQGIGVPEADRAFLFDAFSRASNVGDKPGSGLGLFIAQKCAQAHGGLLGYLPHPGGSTFSLTIPHDNGFQPLA